MYDTHLDNAMIEVTSNRRDMSKSPPENVLYSRWLDLTILYNGPKCTEKFHWHQRIQVHMFYPV
jgi:hypothetical protein